MEGLMFWSTEREVEWIAASTGLCSAGTQVGKLCNGKGGTRVCSERIDENLPAGEELGSALSGYLRLLYSKDQQRIRQLTHTCFL